VHDDGEERSDDAQRGDGGDYLTVTSDDLPAQQQQQQQQPVTSRLSYLTLSDDSFDEPPGTNMRPYGAADGASANASIYDSPKKQLQPGYVNVFGQSAPAAMANSVCQPRKPKPPAPALPDYLQPYNGDPDVPDQVAPPPPANLRLGAACMHSTGNSNGVTFPPPVVSRNGVTSPPALMSRIGGPSSPHYAQNGAHSLPTVAPEALEAHVGAPSTWTNRAVSSPTSQSARAGGSRWPPTQSGSDLDHPVLTRSVKQLGTPANNTQRQHSKRK
jgi:hypothetical protein